MANDVGRADIGRRLLPDGRELRSCDDPNVWCMYSVVNLSLAGATPLEVPGHVTLLKDW